MIVICEPSQQYTDTERDGLLQEFHQFLLNPFGNPGTITTDQVYFYTKSLLSLGVLYDLPFVAEKIKAMDELKSVFGLVLAEYIINSALIEDGDKRVEILLNQTGADTEYRQNIIAGIQSLLEAIDRPEGWLEHLEACFFLEKMEDLSSILEKHENQRSDHDRNNLSIFRGSRMAIESFLSGDTSLEELTPEDLSRAAHSYIWFARDSNIHRDKALRLSEKISQRNDLMEAYDQAVYEALEIARLEDQPYKVSYLFEIARQNKSWHARMVRVLRTLIVDTSQEVTDPLLQWLSERSSHFAKVYEEALTSLIPSPSRSRQLAS